MRPIATEGVVWSVCLSVSRSVTTVTPAKAVRPIAIPFGLWTLVDRRGKFVVEKR